MLLALECVPIALRVAELSNLILTLVLEVVATRFIAICWCYPSILVCLLCPRCWRVCWSSPGCNSLASNLSSSDLFFAYQRLASNLRSLPLSFLLFSLFYHCTIEWLVFLPKSNMGPVYDGGFLWFVFRLSQSVKLFVLLPICSISCLTSLMTQLFKHHRVSKCSLACTAVPWLRAPALCRLSPLMFFHGFEGECSHVAMASLHSGIWAATRRRTCRVLWVR